MFKPLPLTAIGVITQSATRYATRLQVDTTFHTIIGAVLEAGDYTYLHIQHGAFVEVVKVIEVLADEFIRVVRGQSNTAKQEVSANSPTYYAQTRETIFATLQQVLTPITVDESGSVEIENGIVNIALPEFTVEGDLELLVKAQGVYSIGAVNETLGCKPYQCPGYEISPFVVVSRPYPIEDENGLGFNLRIASGRLAYQPSFEDATAFSLVVLGGDLFGGGQTHTFGQTPGPNGEGDDDANRDRLLFALQPLSGEMYGGGQTTEFGPDAILLNLEVLGGELFGAGIEYFIPKEAVQFNLEIIGGTLAP